MPSAADFVDGFRRFWAAPSLDGLPALLAPDVKLVQPLAPVMRGLGGRQLWRSGAATALIRRNRGGRDAHRVHV